MIIKILGVARWPYCFDGCGVTLYIDVQKVDPIPPIETGFIMLLGGIKPQEQDFLIRFQEIKHIYTAYLTLGHKLTVLAGVKIGPLHIVTDKKEIYLI